MNFYLVVCKMIIITWVIIQHVGTIPVMGGRMISEISYAHWYVVRKYDIMEQNSKARAVPWKLLHSKISQYFGVLDSLGMIRHDLSVSNISLAHIYIYIYIYIIQLLKLLCFFQFKWVMHLSPNSLGPTQGGRHFRTAFSGAFSWMNMYKF